MQENRKARHRVAASAVVVTLVIRLALSAPPDSADSDTCSNWISVPAYLAAASSFANLLMMSANVAGSSYGSACAASPTHCIAPPDDPGRSMPTSRATSLAQRTVTTGS